MDPIDVLKDIRDRYADQADRIFVTFTLVNKLGINPMTEWDKTPLGIYAYPIDYVIKMKMDVPFAGSMPYIQVFLVTGDPHSVWNFGDPEQMPKIKQRFAEVWGGAFGRHVEGLQLKDFWDYIRYATKTGHKMTVDFRNAFVHVGILGIIDPGKGIIHDHEPTQAVFFSTKILKVVDVIDNTNKERKANRSKLMIPIDYDNISAAKAYELACLKLPHRSPRLEAKFAGNQFWGYQYAFKLGKRFEAGEPAIFTDPALKAYYNDMVAHSTHK